MRLILFLFFLSFFSNLKSQDFVSAPSSNPSLFPLNFSLSESQNKLLNQEDSIIYLYDTLQLPFIDDFTSNKLRSRVDDPLNDPRVRDTTLYAIKLTNGNIYLDTIGFVIDTTWIYQIGSSGLKVDSTANFEGLVIFTDISRYPVDANILEYYFPYDVYDSLNGNSDTIFKIPTLFQDSVKYYLVEKNTESFYIDRDVYINNTYGFYPPSIGVASFDGLNEDGLPYNFEDISITAQADFLTSKPIDLSAADDSIYFSFYYQAKGFFINGPEREDSLNLDFYNASTKRWGNVWGSRGIELDSFKQVILRVPADFKSDAFQFRFRNKANVTGAYDVWNVDYIYLNDRRRRIDTVRKDLAFVYDATPLLKDYYAMPVWHFKTDPSVYMADTVRITVRNNFINELNLFNKIVIPDTTNPTTPYYIFPGTNQFLPIREFSGITIPYPINFSYPTSAIDTSQIFKAICDVDFRPAAIEIKDFIRANDTVISKAVLKDYYAYDDGSAEAGYGINAGTFGGNETYIAVEFNSPFPDTIGGVMMYYLPQNFDARKQKVELRVWNSLRPTNLLFQKEMTLNPIYGKQGGMITYFFDSLIEVGTTFHIGLRSLGKSSLNIGYDLNTNAKDKISWSLDGSNWSFPNTGIPDGSLMLRPIFRKKNFGVGLKENSKKDVNQFKIYPQPASNTLYIDSESLNFKSVRIYSIQGSLVYNTAYSNVIHLEGIQNGIYILELESNQGEISRKKFIISK
jgi:hypothetical protein